MDFSFSLPGQADTDTTRLQALEAAARQHLGEYFYADDGSSLEQVVLRRLQVRGHRLALAEVASGGSLAAALNGATGARAVLHGAFAAPTEARLAALLQAGPWRAGDSAEARARSHVAPVAPHPRASWAVAIGEGRVESGSLQLWVAVKTGERCETRALSFRDLGDASRASLVTQVLDLLRRTPEPP